MTDLHPMTVHFPLALGVVWPLVDLSGFALRRPEIAQVATGLLALSLVSALLSTVTGQSAFDAARKAGFSAETMNPHRDLADLVPWILLLVLGLRWFLLRRYGRRGQLLSLLSGLLLWPVFFSVGRSGASLVYESGVGVSVPERSAAQKEKP